MTSVNGEDLQRLLTASDRYDVVAGPAYDDVFQEVSARIAAHGYAGKLDIAALTVWKRSAQGRWVGDLMSTPESEVRNATASAFVATDDRTALMALASLPGYGAQGPLATALLTAHDPARYAVMDRRAFHALSMLNLPVERGRGQTLRFLEVVRDLQRVAATIRPGITTRDIDKGLFVMGELPRRPRSGNATP